MPTCKDSWSLLTNLSHFQVELETLIPQDKGLDLSPKCRGSVQNKALGNWLILLGVSLLGFLPLVGLHHATWDYGIWVHLFRTGEWEAFRSVFQEAGTPFSYWVHLPLQWTSDPFPWLVGSSLFFQGISAGLWMEIVSLFYPGRRNLGFFSGLLFLVLPLNDARWYIPMYQLYLVLCLFAIWILARRPRSFWSWMAAIPLAVLSFNLASLIFVWIAFGAVWVWTNEKSSSWRRRAIAFSPFLIAAGGFVIFKESFWKPTGAYLTYNRPEFSILAPLYSLATPALYLLRIAQVFYDELRAIFSATALMFVFGLTWLVVKKDKEFPGFQPWAGWFFIAAVAWLTFPYVLVKQLVHYSRFGPVLMTELFSSRHHFPSLLGMSLLCLWILSQNFLRGRRQIALALLIAVGFVHQWSVSIELLKEDHKQSEIRRLFRENVDTLTSDLLLIKDETLEWNAMNRPYNAYDWTVPWVESAKNERMLILTQSADWSPIRASILSNPTTRLTSLARQARPCGVRQICALRGPSKPSVIQIFLGLSEHRFELSCEPPITESCEETPT